LMPTYEIDGPGGKTYSIEGPPDMSRDQVVAAIKRRLPQQQETAAPPWLEQAKDIGRGAVHGLARGIEELPQQLPFHRLRQAATTITGALPGGYGPEAQAQKYVDQPHTPAGKATEHVARAAPTAPLQPGGLITKGVTTIGAGLGEYGGEEAARAVGLPPSVGGAIGGILGGGATGAGAQLTAEMKARKLLPSSEAVRDYSKGMYNLVEQHGLTIEPTEVQTFAAGLRANLDRVYMTDLGGKTGYTAADRIEKANGDLAVIMDEYRNLGTIKPNAGPNYSSAQIARDDIIQWIGNLQQNQVVSGDPAFTSLVWQQARDAWRVHAQLETLDKVLQSGEWRKLSSGQGHNLNAMRQQVRKIIDNDSLARRYTPEQRVQMAEIVEGTLAQNALRFVSAFAPHGAVSSLPAIAIGAVTHDAWYALATAGTAEMAYLLRKLLDKRSVDLLRDTIREQAPNFVNPERAARARLLAHNYGTTPQGQRFLAPGRISVGAVRGALAAGAESPLSEDQQ
jgi:hypothetical protein